MWIKKAISIININTAGKSNLKVYCEPRYGDPEEILNNLKEKSPKEYLLVL